MNNGTNRQEFVKVIQTKGTAISNNLNKTKADNADKTKEWPVFSGFKEDKNQDRWPMRDAGRLKPNKSIREIEHIVKELLDEKRYEEALGYQRELAIRLPNDFQTRLNLARTMRNLGLCLQAHQTCNDAIKLIKTENGKGIQAIHRLRGHVSLSLAEECINDPNYKYDEKKRQMTNDYLKQVVEDEDEALKYDSNDLEAHVNRALALVQLKRHEEAVGNLQQAIKIAEERVLKEKCSVKRYQDFCRLLAMTCTNAVRDCKGANGDEKRKKIGYYSELLKEFGYDLNKMLDDGKHKIKDLKKEKRHLHYEEFDIEGFGMDRKPMHMKHMEIRYLR